MCDNAVNDNDAYHSTGYDLTIFCATIQQSGNGDIKS